MALAFFSDLLFYSRSHGEVRAKVNWGCAGCGKAVHNSSYSTCIFKPLRFNLLFLTSVVLI